MDYSFLDDPGAIAEILASAEPEHRAMQRAQGWDDKTLAIEIATTRFKNEEAEWKVRVLLMSDEDLEQEDDRIRAKVDPYVEEYRAMSGEERGKEEMLTMIEKMKWAKRRFAFTKKERESREEKKRYSERVQPMSTEVFTKEIEAITDQLQNHNQELMALPFNAEPSVREEIERRTKLLEAKYEVVSKERNRRAPT